MNFYILIAFVIYFITLLSISFFFYKKNKSSEDFMVGGRTVNYWVTAIAAQSSDMSSWLFLALPGIIYAKGLFDFWVAIGLIIFMYLTWYFIAPKLRTETEKFNSLTLSSYFESKFNDTSGFIRIATACMTLFFFTYYIASGFVGLGRIFESSFDINYHTGIIISIIIAVASTIIGGFTAVAWTALFQGLFLLTTLIIVPLYAFNFIDGIPSIIDAAHKYNVSLSLIPDYSWNTLWQIIVLTSGWGIGYFGQPHILINFMGINDVKNMKKARIVGTTWQITSLVAATAVGLIGLAFFPQRLTDPEFVFVYMVRALFHPLLVGFILCGILAATISTIHTQILVSTSTLAEDIYKKLFHPQATSEQILWISRIGALIFPLIAFAIAFNDTETIYEAVNYAWSGLGSSFGPLLIASLYWCGVTRWGAVAGIIAGGLTSGLWPLFNSTVLPLTPGFFMSSVALFVVSKLTQN